MHSEAGSSLIIQSFIITTNNIDSINAFRYKIFLIISIEYVTSNVTLAWHEYN